LSSKSKTDEIHVSDFSTVQPSSGESLLRTLQYSLPDILQGHVDMVQPTTFFGLRAMRATVSAPRPLVESVSDIEGVEAVTGCSGSQVTPKCLSNLYSFSGATKYTNGLFGYVYFALAHDSGAELLKYILRALQLPRIP